MKRILVVITFLVISIVSNAQLKLSQSQLVNGIPSGIVEDIPYPVKFINEDELLLFYPKSGSYSIYKLSKQSKTFTDYQPSTNGDPELIKKAAAKLGKEALNLSLSPDKRYIAYTKGNNLYCYNIAKETIKQLTFDGSEDILNGYASWVYYEEILGRSSRYKAFWWSPDSETIAFYRFDNSNVEEFPIYSAKGQRGSFTANSYPKPGEANPTVKIGFANIQNESVVWTNLEDQKDQYFGIPFWDETGSRFILPWMSRDQKDMLIYSVNPINGDNSVIYKEHQDTFIDWPNQLVHTEKGFYFIRDFDKSGWEQIYYLSYDGKVFHQMTRGNNWGIKILSFDKKYLYYTSRTNITTINQVFRVSIKDNYIQDMISLPDYNFTNVVISPKGEKFAAHFSNSKTPTKVAVIDIKNQDSWLIADSRGEKYYSYKIATPEILFFSNRDGQVLPIKIIFPVNMKEGKKYPVHVDIYGGPNHTNVMDTWSNPSFDNQWWATNGVIQVYLDNRASGHLGKKGINDVYGNLGYHELNDYVDAMSWLIRHYDCIDPDKVGIEGFSFGGTMTVLAVTKANKVFKYGIAGGGVYDWMLYDTHYTERYMNTPQNNPKGYKSSRAMNYLDNYYGDETNMLQITHGTGDDNVHFQNTLQLIDELMKKGKRFELMIYPDGMHGYRGYQREFWDRENMIFWYKYLLNKPLPDILNYSLEKE